MKNKMNKWVASIIFMSISLCYTAFADMNLIENKDYTKLPANLSNLETKTKQIKVVEFFNYGCPACNRLEPSLEKWLAKKPKDVDFERIPVTFEQGWDNTAKVYYLVSALDLENKLTPLIFKAIHQENLDYTNIDILKNFLIAHNISSAQIDNAFSSPSMQLAVEQGAKAMVKYQVMEIPAFVVNDEYKTTAGMTKGDDHKLLGILDTLIIKVRKEKSLSHNAKS